VHEKHPKDTKKPKEPKDTGKVNKKQMKDTKSPDTMDELRAPREGSVVTSRDTTTVELARGAFVRPHTQKVNVSQRIVCCQAWGKGETESEEEHVYHEANYVDTRSVTVESRSALDQNTRNLGRPTRARDKKDVTIPTV
jgi:hypothetical protein